MTLHESGPVQDRAEQAATISREMVSLVKRTAGRGPTKARTTIGRDHVLVMLHDSLTEGERTLVRTGHIKDAETVRRDFQAVMGDEAKAMVTGITGREVTSFMSSNDVAHEPDVASEVFLFAPAASAEYVPPQEAELVNEAGFV